MSAKNSRLAQEVEEIENILEKLKERAQKGTPVIVEGRNDVKALNRLDISGRLVELKSSEKSIFNQLEYDIANEEVIIFTDFDRHGSDLARAIHTNFQKRGKKADILLWKRMRELVSRNVKDVEGLPSYLATLRKRAIKTFPETVLK